MLVMQAACPHPAPPTAGRALAVSRGNCDADHPRLSTAYCLHRVATAASGVARSDAMWAASRIRATSRWESPSCGAARLPATIVTATRSPTRQERGGGGVCAHRWLPCSTQRAWRGRQPRPPVRRSRAAPLTSAEELQRDQSQPPVRSSREAAITAATTSTSSSARTSRRSRRRSADAAVPAPSAHADELTTDHHDQAGGDRRDYGRAASRAERRSRGLELLTELVDPGWQ